MPRRTFRTLFLLLACWASAQALALTQRAAVTQRGDFAMIGNTLAQDCGPGVVAPVVGTVGACGTNTSDTAPDLFWRADDPASGQASATTGIAVSDARSTAVLSLPSGARITHAWLYWGASGIPGGTALLERPGVFSQSVTATDTTTAILNGPAYRSVADVTALVQAQGPGPYRVGGVDALPLTNVNNSSLFAAWWMVVLYELDGEPVRHLAIYDGLEQVLSGGSSTTTVTGFTAVPGGTAKIGVVGFDGDDSLTGDQLIYNGFAVSDAQNPANNIFNSSRSWLGSAVSNAGDLPQLTGTPRSMSGIDLDVIDVSAGLGAGQTSVTVTAATTSDIQLYAALVHSVETAAPLLAGTMTVTDLAGAPLLPGHTLEYAVTVRNDGSAAAQDVAVTATLPAGLHYVPGSLRILSGDNAGAKTDAAGDDQADYDAATQRWTVRLGAGAGAAQGGTLAAGGSTEVRLQATVDAVCSGDAVFGSQAEISAGNAATALTDGDAGTAGLQPTEAAMSVRCLALSLNGPGSVTGASSGPVATGTTLQLTASPDTGAVFSHWSGAAGGNANPLSLLMDADKSLTAQFDALAPQAITGFGATPAVPVFSIGGSFALHASGGASAQPVVFSSLTPAVCSVSGSTVTMLSAGTCTLAADQAGDAAHAAAARVTFSLVLGSPGDIQAVPTLNFWGQLLLALLAAASGMGTLRRR